MPEDIPTADDLIYDVGLHKGEDSAYYLAKGYRVVAFEANPTLAQRGRERFASEIDAARMTIVEGAITDSSATSVRFFLHPNSVWGTTQPDWVERNAQVAESEPIDVPAVRFSSILRRTGMPYYMKVDVEGADTLCLRSLLIFKHHPRYLSIESEQNDWAVLESEFELLCELGYDRFAVVQQATIPGRTISTYNRTGDRLTYRFEPDASGPFGEDLELWHTRSGALDRYGDIFCSYRRFGSDSLIRRTKLGRVLLGQAQRLTGRATPGWFDTHASSSADCFSGNADHG